MLHFYLILVIIVALGSALGVPLETEPGPADTKISSLPLLNIDNPSHDLVNKISTNSDSDSDAQTTRNSRRKKNKNRRGEVRDPTGDVSMITPNSGSGPGLFFIPDAMKQDGMSLSDLGLMSSVISSSTGGIQFSELHKAVNQTKNEMTDLEFFSLVIDAFLKVVSGRLKTVKSFSLQLNPDIEQVFLFLDKDSKMSSRVPSPAFPNRDRSESEIGDDQDMRSRFKFTGLANVKREGGIEVINRENLERKTISFNIRIGPVDTVSVENMSMISIVNFTVSGNMEIRLKTGPDRTTLYMSDLILRNPTEREIINVVPLLKVLPVSPTALVHSAVSGLQFEGLLKKVMEHTLRQPAIFNIFTAIPEFLH